MIRLRLFGTVELLGGETEEAAPLLTYAKPTALLACLAAGVGAFHRRDRLIALLWPELDGVRARNALSKAIHLCRRSLGDEAFLTRGSEDLGLNPGRWWCDVTAFADAAAREDPVEAFALYQRGELLEGFHLDEAPEFEHWLDGERMRLRRLAIGVAGSAADAAERAGDLPAEGEWLGVLSDLAPHDEVVLRRRLDLLDRLGDRAGAISQYQRHRARLMRELELEPSRETEALVARIRDQAPAGIPRPRRPTGAPASAGSAARPAKESSPGLNRSPAEALPRPVPAVVWGMGILAAVAGAVLIAGTRRDPPAVEGRILVAPFANQTGDTTLKPVGEMAADWLTLGLSRTGLLDVVDSRTRIRGTFPGTAEEATGSAGRIATLARATGATTVVRGAYYRLGDSLVVIARILHGNGERVIHVLSPVAGPVAEPLEIVERVRQQVLGWFAARADPRLTAWATGASEPPTYAAYAEYVAGLGPWTAGDRRSAVRHFERAYAIDSGFVAILPWLIEGLSNTGNRVRADSLLDALERRRDRLPPFDQAVLDQQMAWRAADREAVLEATRRMVRLAPASPDANWWHGFAATTTNRFAEAIAAFDRVEAGSGWTRDATFASLNWPTTAHHLLGDYAGELARVTRYRLRFPEDPEACAYEMRARIALSPRDSLDQRLDRCAAIAPAEDPAWAASLRRKLAAELRTHGAPKEAVRLARQAAEWFRERRDREPQVRAWREGLGSALLEAGEWSEARQIFESELPRLPDGRPPRFAGNAGVAAARLGDRATAERMLQRLAADTTALPFFNWQRARVLASLGRREEAVAELRKMVGKGLSAAELFHADIGIERLRAYPPYEKLVRPRP